MRIKNLADTELSTIVDGILEAFEGYFVQMPSDVNYWANRYKGARVDYGLSFGAFDNGKLVAFIINGIDELDGKKTAFNTGTGVIPSYRNRQLVDKIYAFANPVLLQNGVEQCVLEVIQDNTRAIRVYERIGFEKVKNYECFKGDLKIPEEEVKIEAINFKDLNFENPHEHFYSWDNCDAAITISGDLYKTYRVQSGAETLGFFVINPTNGTLHQFELFKPKSNWAPLFNGIALVSSFVKINNIDDRRSELIKALTAFGLDNHINQFEMQMTISK